MSACPEPQDFCKVFPGSSLPLTFKFQDIEGNPIDVSDTELLFTVRNIEIGDFGPSDMQIKHTFPSNEDSINGLGSLIISGIETSILRENETYHFTFIHEGAVVGYGNLPTGFKIAEEIIQ
jgi:hypothetical protein